MIPKITTSRYKENRQRFMKQQLSQLGPYKSAYKHSVSGAYNKQWSFGKTGTGLKSCVGFRGLFVSKIY